MVPVSLHCWQIDDVIGFDNDGGLTGGIQTTGNYPGKATNPDEFFADMEKVISMIPGKPKINVHANYAIFEEDGFVDRDKLEPRHFKRWVELAKNTTQDLTLTRHSSHMRRLHPDLPCHLRMKRSANSGSITAKLVSVSPSILQRRQDSHAL